MRHYTSKNKLLSAGSDDNYGSVLLKVTPGKTYITHDFGIQQGGYYDKYFTYTLNYPAIDSITFNNYVFTVPDNDEIAYALLTIRKSYNSETEQYSLYNEYCMVQEGDTFTGYEEFQHIETGNIVPTDEFKEIINDSIDTSAFAQNPITPEQTSFFEYKSSTCKNLLHENNINWSARHQNSGVKIVSDMAASTKYVSVWIPVDENETYMYTGNVFQGGYYDTNDIIINKAAIGNIEFIAPVSGNGKYFIVPSGQNIHYALITLLLSTTEEKENQKLSDQSLNTFQVELGEISTEVIPYVEDNTLIIPAKYLDIEQSNNTSNNSSKSYSDRIKELDPIQFSSDDYTKVSNFFNHYLAKDKDLVIVNTGTSLTARATEHATEHPKAKFRPPCFDSNNFCSMMWDTIIWEGQEYRRYDSGWFTESGGTFNTSYALSEWDDGAYRRGWTRYINNTIASISCKIPSDAFQFNFIYRTDTVGDENVTLTITEGNNKVEVFNGTTWLEANGYTFSMLEEVKYLTNVQYPSPTAHNALSSTVVQYQISGNTTYQKRLKMRCKSGNINSIGTEKNINITSSGTGRFMYWGVEWSPREFMVTYINSARGSHGFGIAGSGNSLHKFIDNEIISYKPDLIFSENPIHNSGGSSQSSNYNDDYFGYAAYDFFTNTDCPVSIISRAVANGINANDLDFITFTSTITWNFHGIYGKDDGETDESKIGKLKFAPTKDGTYCTGLDLQTMSNRYLQEHSKGLHINACQYFCDGAVAIYGDMKSATIGSGQAGDTLTNEGSHWNDNGSLLMFNCMRNLFNIYK